MLRVEISCIENSANKCRVTVTIPSRLSSTPLTLAIGYIALSGFIRTRFVGKLFKVQFQARKDCFDVRIVVYYCYDFIGRMSAICSELECTSHTVEFMINLYYHLVLFFVSNYSIF